MVNIAQTFHENWKCDPSRNGGGEEKKGYTSTHTTSYGVHVPTHQFDTNVGVRTTYTPANFGHCGLATFAEVHLIIQPWLGRRTVLLIKNYTGDDRIVCGLCFTRICVTSDIASLQTTTDQLNFILWCRLHKYQLSSPQWVQSWIMPLVTSEPFV